jgi:WD40 repeat protein
VPAGSGGSAAAGGAGGSSAGGSTNPPAPTTLVPHRLIAAPCRWLAPGSAQDVAFSPDGTLLATASGGFVKLYDAATGQQVRATPWHAGITRTFSFSPDGQRIAVGVTGQGDPGVFVYRVSDMALVTRLAEGRRAPSVAYSADGRWLAAALTRTDPTDVVDVWNAADFTLEVELAATGEHRLSAIGFHPDGSTLFGLGYFSHTWSTATWQTLSEPFRLSSDTDPLWPSRMVFANDGSRGTVSRSSRGNLVPSIPSHDGTLVARGAEDGSVALSEKLSNTLLFSFAAQAGLTTGLAFSPDDSLLAATSEDGTLFTSRVRDGLEVWHSGASIFPGELVGASRDGTKVVLKSKGDHSVVSGADGSLLGKLPLDYGSCVTDQSAERLACSNEEGPNFVSLNGVPRNAGIDPVAPELRDRGAVALVPDAPVFVQALGFASNTIGLEYTVRLSNLDDAAFREIAMPARTTDSGYFNNNALALALSDDGQRLAAGVAASYAGVGGPRRDIGYVWDVSSLELVATFGSTGGYPVQASSVAIAPGGNWVAVADRERDQLIVFDVARSAESRYVVEGVCGLEHLAASPDGTLLAVDMVFGAPLCSESSPTQTILIDVAAGVVVATLPGGAEGALAFLSVASLVRGEADGATSVWCLQ